MSTTPQEEARAAGCVVDDYAESRLYAIRRTSPSALDQWELCPRRWFRGYVENVREQQSAAQAAGTDIDDNYVQPYLKTGKIPDGKWSPLVHKLVPDLPPPGKETLVQVKERIPTYPGGPEMTVKPDFVRWRAPRRLSIGDLKTTSAFRYSKTHEQLAENTQLAVSYARWGYVVMNAEEVDVYHVNGLRDLKKPASHRVPALNEPPLVISRERNTELWETKMPKVRLMVAAARAATGWRELPYNNLACDLFPPNKCPLRNECDAPDKGGKAPNPFGGLLSKIKQEGEKIMTLSLLEQIRAAKNGTPPPVAQTTQTQPVNIPAPKPEDLAGYRAPVAAPPAPTEGPKKSLLEIAKENAAKSASVAAPPGDKGVEGYEPGQGCLGNGYYANRNGQGFTDVEPGHVHSAKCKVPQAAAGAVGVLPPEVTQAQRESSPEQIAAVEADKKTKGKKKAAAPKLEAAVKVSVECRHCGGLFKEDKINEHLAQVHNDARPAGAPEPAAEPVKPEPTEDEKLQALGFTATMIARLRKENVVAEALAGEVQPQHLVEAPKETPETRSAEAPSKAAVLASGGTVETTTVADAVRAAARAELQAAIEKYGPTDQAKPPMAPVLYIDCAPETKYDERGPMGDVAIESSAWLEPICELAARANVNSKGQPDPVKDWRMISYVADGVLANAIRAAIETCPAALVLDSSRRADQVAIEVLLPHAALVVRGRR